MPVNYNQKLYDKGIVIALQYENNNNHYDNTVTSDPSITAIGQKTYSDDVMSKRIDIYDIQFGTYLNQDSSTTFKLLDDSGLVSSCKGTDNKYWTSIGWGLDGGKGFLHFGVSIKDTNIYVDDWGNLDGCTANISDAIDTPDDTRNFTVSSLTLPDDVTTNLKQGSLQTISNSNIVLKGNIQKNDKFTITYSGKSYSFTVNTPTDILLGSYNIPNNATVTATYEHVSTTPVTPPTPTIHDVTFVNGTGVNWVTATDKSTAKQNVLVVQPGYQIPASINILFHGINGKPDQTYNWKTGGNIKKSGDKWLINLPDMTNFDKAIIKDGAEIIKYNVDGKFQNAHFDGLPKYEDDYGNTWYYVDINNHTVNIKANDGYKFTNDGEIDYNQGALDSETYTIKAPNSDTYTIDLTTLPSWDWSKNSNTIMITLGAVKQAVVDDTGGFVNLYKADYPNLLKFSNEVIPMLSSSGSIINYDITSYISGLVMLPVDVPADQPATIVAGNQAFKTELPTLKSDRLTIDVGNIIVSEQYKNAYDYYQVKTRLVLPFTDTVQLDPVHVINKTVKVQYVINCSNGDTTINVSSNDDLFFTKQVNLASEIPFLTASNSGKQYAVINQLKTMYRNDVHQAYIIIEQPTPILNSDYYPTNEKGMLKSYNGNVKATLLNNLPIDVNDNVALQNLLQQGVKINGTTND